MLEPNWGVDLLQRMNSIISSSDILYSIAAGFADLPIFLLPVFLLWLYIWRGMVQGRGASKYAALHIFVAAVVTTFICLFLQQIIDKARPETALMSAGRLVMQHLPTKSFPSDHASVSMAVALAALARGSMNSKRKIMRWGYVLLVGSILMSIARVAVGVHWPTDIIAGRVVGAIAVLIVFQKPVRKFLETYLYSYIVQAEERTLRTVGLKKKA